MYFVKKNRFLVKNKIMNKFLQVLVVFASFNSMAQTNVYLSFPPKVGGNDLVLGDIVQDLNGVDMKIDDFNWYLSNIRIGE